MNPSPNCYDRNQQLIMAVLPPEILVAFAKQSVSSGRAIAGRSVSLRILCDQLEHTRANLARLDAEIEQHLRTDPGVKGLQQVPEFGQKRLSVLRAE